MNQNIIKKILSEELNKLEKATLFNNQFPLSVTQYDQSDICIGVPCVIGKNGLEEVIQLDLNDDELTKFNESADAVRSMNSTLVDHT